MNKHDSVKTEDIRKMPKIQKEIFEAGVKDTMRNVSKRALMQDYEERR